MSRRAACLLALLLPARAATALGDDFPAPPDTEPSASRALAPAEAAARWQAPEGFRVSVFAAEPDVRNPIALAWGPRGRLWVAENYTYAEAPKRFDFGLRDRVLVFEDRDGDGAFDRRTVFTDDVQGLASVEVGQGGVWLLCPPRLLFVPDRDGDAAPDGPAEVVLDGFKVAQENHHTFANGLNWGPDGWLYGRCGASSPGEIGAPGTAEAERVPLRGGVWRFHPQKRRFEALAHGTTNPWGHDWDALGELFFINTVNGHLWHMLPGSHLVRPHTIEPNPRAYALIDQHADHWHWDNSRELKYGPTGAPEDDRRGGGHAHSGMMIYQADQWPAAYRGKLFTLNLHGRRVNVERLEREGSGFAGRHEPDILQAADPWFRGIDLSYGPDGAVYVLDWSDTGECHEHDGVHRNSGRVFRVTHGKAPAAAPFDLRALDDDALLAFHRHSNEWYVRQARRVLVDRAGRKGTTLDALRAVIRDERDPVQKLRALWTLYALGGADDVLLRRLLRHDHEAVRAWAVRLLTDDLPIDTIFSKRPGPDVAPAAGLVAEFIAVARDDPSGLVRLALASALQRLPVDRRLPLAEALASRAEDAADHNLPALVWTALVPVAEADPSGLVAFAGRSAWPSLVRYTARRLGEEIDARPGPVNALLEAATARPEGFRGLVLAGLADALKGRRKARPPEAWAAFRDLCGSQAAQRDQARDLDVVFGDGRALEAVRALALDTHADIEARKAALQSLIEARPPDLRAVCERLVGVRFLNAVAVRGLTLFDDPAIGRALAASYRTFQPSERPAALEALVSRPAFAAALLDAVAAGRIPRSDLTPFHARQLRGMKDPELDRRLAAVWGELRDSPADRVERARKLKGIVLSAPAGVASAGRGRPLFDRLCASCHKLYGRGGDLGPDLTGAGRDNLDYLLENLVDPGASVSADFRMTVVALRDGRVLNGLLRATTEHTIALQTPTERLNLDRADVEQIASSPQSLMPEGLVDALSPAEFRDLIAYLGSRAQVSAPPGP